MIPLLKNNNLYIRALETQDLDILYKWENNTQLWIHGNTLSPYSKLTLRQYITDSQIYDIYQLKQLRLMIELTKTNEVIGAVDIYDVDVRNQKAGVGVLIDEEFRNNNYAYESISLLINYAFSFLRLHQLYAYIAIDNTFSIKLFQKCGFKLSATLKDWIHISDGYQDVYIYQIINDNE